MERLPPEGNGERGTAQIAVDRIAQQRMPGMSEVDPDLVRPSRPEPRLDQRRDAEPLENAPFGDRPGPALPRPRHAAPPVTPVLDEVLVEGAGVALEIPLDRGEVPAVHRVGPELCLQLHEPPTGACEDENPRGLLVEPVDDGDEGPSPAPVPALDPCRDTGQKSVPLFRLGGMRQEPRRLDDGDRVVVLEEDLEGGLDAAADRAAPVPRRARLPVDEPPGVVDHPPVHGHLPFQDGPLQPRGRDIGVELLKAADDPKPAHAPHPRTAAAHD